MSFQPIVPNEAQRRDASTTVQDPMLRRAPDIAAMMPYWDLTDALVEGAHAVRLAGKEYLPKFPQEDQPTYDFRVAVTKFTNVYRDIVEGLASKPFEEEISLPEEDGKPVPEEIDEFIEDVDGSGNNLTVFGSAVFFNGINSAIDWIFVDYPTVDSSVVRTVADLKTANIRPFWSRVLARNVLEVKSKIINGIETLSYMRILEPGNPCHVRVFENIDGAVTWKLYVETNTRDPVSETCFVIEDQGLITIGVIPLVPFYTGRRDGRTFKFFPAMRDAADLQIELYQQESALKFIKIMAGYPMLAANGLKPAMGSDGKPLPVAIGPMRILWGIPDAAGNHGSWSFIEPSATSMKFLADDIKDTKQDLRELGRQPLTAQSGNLTVITTAVAASKSKSAVGAWALLLKDALENALVITAKWMNVEYDPQVNVFNEFDNFAEDGKDLDTLNTARAARDISQETYWAELKRRKVLSPEFDGEQELKRLLDETPGEGDDTMPLPASTKPPVKPLPGEVE